MSHRLLARLLLSLLLLMSQQIAVSHGYSHWTSTRNAVAAEAAQKDSRVPKSLASDHACALCIAAAHFASAVGTSAFCFFAPDCSYFQVSAVTFAACLRTVSVYLSRAPPQA
jgi:hypothetical protein